MGGICCRSREGAWIEIVANKLAAESYNVAPARERGLKFLLLLVPSPLLCVAPARERGLKYVGLLFLITAAKVAPARERGLKL